jgi:lipid-binding SYLF domain-containing protein
MRITSRLSALVVTAVLVPALIQAQEREDARLVLATDVMETLNNMPDQNIPGWLLDRAHGVVVIPGVVKVGLGIAGRRGKGVMAVRREDGTWSNPVFVTLTGGSFGWQAGVQEADIVLVFTTKAGVEGITDGKLTLGADASVAAGPVGRATSAATDANFSAEVYSYSRTRGLFAGLAIDGTAITIDRKANVAFYQKRDVTPSEILAATAPSPPPSARRFMNALSSSTTRTAANPADAAAPQAPSTQPEQQKDSKFETFPMEDSNPGKEPPQ